MTLVGAGRKYDATDFTAFQRAQKVAITNYHSVFNTSPRIDSAQTLILDDAHAGEGPVASLWSIQAPRESGLYRALIAALRDGLPRSFAEAVSDEGLDPDLRYEVELVPPTFVAQRADLIREALAAHATERDNPNHWAAQMVTAEIGHCLTYVSWREILIRPLIPPTIEHAPFADADKRVYMSATLGSGGELERSFGVPRIERLEVPAGWDERSSGRRFFLFPNATPNGGVDDFIAQAIEETGKALVIAPSQAGLDRFAATAVPATVPEMRPAELDHDFSAFAGAQRAVLLLANRYDGIDLPGDACRLVVLTGLPAATHLQERFLYDRLRAKRVLEERIRARLTQGAGRCTRNARDFAAVVLRGATLLDFCAREENRSTLHREFQAELEFGLDNCEATDDLLGLLRAFLSQGDEWKQGEADIRVRMAELERKRPAHADQLAAAAAGEVEAWRAIWRGDLLEAITLARSVVDRLQGDELRSYRTLWLYLATSWAAELTAETGDPEHERLTNDLRRSLDSQARRLQWTPRVDVAEAVQVAGSEFDTRADNAAATLLNLGVRGHKFERTIAELEQRLAQTAATPFELGLEALGKLLGFESVRPNKTADPDCVWCDGERLWLIFEAKTDERAENPISADAVRQADSHHRWVASELGWPEPAESLTVIVSPKTTIHPDAKAVAGDVRLAAPTTITAISRGVIEIHRALRARAPGLSDEGLAAAFATAFVDRRMGNEELLAQLGRRRIADG